MTPHQRLLHQLYEAISANEDATRFFHPDAEQIEYPSLMRPYGHRRSLAEMREGAELGAKIIRKQRYDVRRVVEAGDEVAVQLTWTAVTATQLGDIPAGTRFVAHVAAFYDFRDDLILRQSSYDCYEPWGETK